MKDARLMKEPKMNTQIVIEKDFNIDMKDIKFRTLKASEIEVRPATIQNGKATMLLYMDSRVVVNLLNESVGPLNWQSDFKEVNGQLIGSISIWDEDKNMWVTKSDTGSESNIEAQKGLVSDCYKRCLSRWGVDELYSAPTIKIDDDGYKCSGYKVSEISYDDNRDITHLVIVNRFGKETFRWDANSNTTNTEAVNKAVKSFGTGKEYDYHEIWAKYCQDKTEKEGIDVNYARSIYKSGLNDASRWKYKEFWPSTLWNNLVKTA